MKIEETWEGTGRDKVLLEDVLEWYAAGIEIVLGDGHITSVIATV